MSFLLALGANFLVDFRSPFSPGEDTSKIHLRIRPNNSREGRSAINLHEFGKFCQFRPHSYLFMLGRSVASKIAYVRPVGGFEDT